MKFVILSIAVFFMIGVGAAAQIFLPLWNIQIAQQAQGWVYLGATLGGLLLLTAYALWLRRAKSSDFDMLVASETIIVFGILSLVLGLALSILLGLNQDWDLSKLDFSELQPMLLPFVEGLITAGVAPALAAMLRNYEVVKYTPGSATSAEHPTEMFDDLRSSVTALADTMGEANTAFSRMVVSINKKMNVYNEAVESLSDATAALCTKLEKQSEQLEQALKSGAANVNGFADRVASAGNQVVSAGEDSASAMQSLVAGTENLKRSMNEATRLLDGLAKLVESVETFIEPGRKRT